MHLDPLWITIAFTFGFAARGLGLPSLVGFLIAGFVLNALGEHGQETFQNLSDLGVNLLLFSIGLKLNVKSLLKPEIWAVALSHCAITTIVLMLGINLLAITGIAVFSQLDWTTLTLLAFALSFSSTVFAVKVLETTGETGSLYGRLAIGILIVQDLIAVLFLAASTGQLPSVWALMLLGLIPLRPVLTKIMERSGHGSLLILYGLFIVLGGTALFQMVGIKENVGALALGILVADHPKSSELSKALLGLKDLFLVGFFLSIGFYGLPTLQTIGISVLLVVAIAFKTALFFWLLTRFRLRVRTSLLTAFTLANYSEFGLIVAQYGVEQGWMDGEWLVIMAITLSLSFILSSPLSTNPTLYARLKDILSPLEPRIHHPEEQPVELIGTEILIFGMGRIGTGAYDVMRDRYGEVVLGVDYSVATVQSHRKEERNVILGDATDSDFWARIKQLGKVRLVMLAMSNHAANVYAAKQIADSDYGGFTAATAKFMDEISELKAQGVQAVFNIYEEAGAGFAEEILSRFNRW